MATHMLVLTIKLKPCLFVNIFFLLDQALQFFVLFRLYLTATVNLLVSAGITRHKNTAGMAPQKTDGSRPSVIVFNLIICS